MRDQIAPSNTAGTGQSPANVQTTQAVTSPVSSSSTAGGSAMSRIVQSNYIHDTRFDFDQG